MFIWHQTGDIPLITFPKMLRKSHKGACQEHINKINYIYSPENQIDIIRAVHKKRRYEIWYETENAL